MWYPVDKDTAKYGLRFILPLFLRTLFWKGGDAMTITLTELLQFCLVFIGFANLLYQIFGKKK